jgi:hypothetical protein
VRPPPRSGCLQPSVDIKRPRSLRLPSLVTTQPYCSALDVTTVVDESERLPSTLVVAREGQLPGMRIRQVESPRQAYLLLCVAVLFVIFQTPLILSRLWKSIQPLESSESKLSWTAAASPT